MSRNQAVLQSLRGKLQIDFCVSVCDSFIQTTPYGGITFISALLCFILIAYTNVGIVLLEN